MPGQAVAFDSDANRQVRVPYGPFTDEGDVCLIWEAKQLAAPAILTTDLKSFWSHREWLYDKGVEVWRPSDLCWAMWHDVLLVEGQFGPRPEWPVGPLAAEQERRLAS